MTHSIHDIGQRPATVRTGYVSAAVLLALMCLGLAPQAAFSADKDKTQHIGNIRYGNEPLMLWSACPGMAHADWIAETLQWMIRPQVDRVQKS